MEQNNQTDLEEVINEVENETPQEEVAEEQKPELDLEKFNSKDDPDVYKVDLSAQSTDEVKEDDSDDTGVARVDENTESTQSEDEVQPEGETQEEAPVLEEITEEETVTKEEVMEALEEVEQTGAPLPENVQKLVEFMNETGGDLEDYVKLNRDTSNLDDQDALLEYYKSTKPHLSLEEINFLMEDNFSYSEDEDTEREIRRKKLAKKEQVAEAKAYLDGQKSKYYEEIKAGSKLTGEQQKAIDFFNRYNEESQKNESVAKQRKNTFTQKTNSVFNKDFKGFDFNVGDKKFRYKVKDVDNVKESQSDINNFIGKFLDESSNMSDAKGYHKGLYTAMNPDAIAQHFYEQGKADALKSSVDKAKNINVNPRQAHGEFNAGGVKYRVLGDDASGLKLKVKKRK